MIKIFNATDTDFKTAGNIIINPLHCHEIKKKSLNGWYIEVEIPIKYKEYIEADKLCVVKTKSKLKPQAFRINDSITYTNRKIKFTAEHVMFDSRRYVLLDARPTNLNGQNGLKYVNERTDKISPFSITSNVENVSTAYFIRKTLLESWQVFEERWGGVFEADNWDISFKQSIGKDNGETIVYGKNMQGFEIFEDWSNVCTKILPVGYDGLLLPEKYLESETQYEIPYTKIVDFQTDLKTEEQTETNLLVELRNNASKYLEENCVPKVSYTVNSNVNNDLEIGDTIKVLHPFVNIFTEVLEYEYDLISEKVKSLTFGNYTRDVKTKFNNIKNTIETIKQTVSKQEITIKEQTNLINSLNKNGYVYIDDNEILILDQLPKEKAKNVWRFGLGGIGFSSKGYEGPFETAITMDGKINADFITTGTMAVDRIESLANFITDTSASIAAIELQQDSITTKVSSVEQSVENITNTEGEATGKNIHLEDSSDDLLVSIKVKGSTTQATRSGKNLLDNTATTKISNGITFTVNSDGTVLADGTNDTTANSSLIINRYDLSPGTYVLNGCPSGGAINTYRLAIQETGSYSVLGSIDIGNGSGEFTIDTTTIVQIAIFIQKGLTINKLLFKPMLRKATIADDTYEQYGASPSSDYPSEIENVEGKNKFSGWVKGIGINSTDGHQFADETRASSDYIAVDFNQNPNYYLSGLANTLQTFVAAYNSNKEFLGRTGAILVSYFSLNSSLFTLGTAQGTGDIAYLRVTTYENTPAGTTGAIDDVDNLETQLEEGTVATPYVPYNSLEVKVERKNRFDINSWYDNLKIPSTVNAIIDNSIITFQGTENQNSYFKSIQNWNLKPNTKYTISIDCQTEISGVNYAYFNLANTSGHDNQYYGVLIPSMTRSILTKTFITDSEGNFYLKGYVNYPNYSANKLIIYSIQIELGTTATPYKPYQEQKVDFPLSEGQKLYEGSYLASDGIHHKRKQIVLNGTEGITNVYVNTSTTRFGFSLSLTPDKKIGLDNVLSTHFKCDTTVYYDSQTQVGICGNTRNVNIYIRVNGNITTDEFKTWLATQYANGTPVIVEYELAEEEIVPYTTAQQEAWNKIEQLHTYKNVTNIFSDAELDIVYVRDNGLSDMYETKQNASKNYTKTVEKFAEQKITTDEINQKVAVVNEKLTEYKQNIDSFSFTTENAGGINLIQNSTLENGLDLYHSTTGTVSIEKNIDVKEKTISKSAIKIINGTVITQEINIIPLEDYTFSCLVYKTELTNVTIKIVSDKIEEYQIEAEPETWQKFSANINSSDNSVIIEIICDNNFCYISDRILNKGNAPLGWQRHNGEFKSDNVTINEDGITVTNTNDNMKHVITSSEDKIINTLNGKTEVSFNPDETKMNSTRINEKLTKGKVRETVRDDGTVMVTMDD